MRVVYDDDDRYPGPTIHPPPDHIQGIPTQAQLDAFPRMFTWGELKEIVYTANLELLMRNKALQARYDDWMTGMKVKYGSTERYLVRARLPWPAPTTDHGHTTFDLSTSLDTPSSSPKSDPNPNPNKHRSVDEHPRTLAELTISTNPDFSRSSRDVSNVATPGTIPGSMPVSISGSGASTPSSAGFVSLSSLKVVNGKLRRAGMGTSGQRSHRSAPSFSRASMLVTADGEDGGSEKLNAMNAKDEKEPAGNGENEEEEGAEGDEPVYLKWEENGLDGEKYAVLPNDWPYNVPYGVRHFCVWSRVPIAHPEMVDYDPALWSKVELDGLGGFTGVTPLRPYQPSHPAPPSDPTNAPIPSHNCTDRNPTSTSPTLSNPSHDSQGRAKFIGKLEDRDWYAADVAYAGGDMRKWAGVEYESPGGKGIGRMVKGLWDPRGWECLWFVNPPRLQSVPGFSHFHVFARRKTPEEIDAAEAYSEVV